MRQSAEAVCRACLGVAVAVYIVVFCRLTFGLYDRYQMMAFDLGIFDQATWLISRGHAPFVTVRGIHLLDDHFSAFLCLLAPLYRLWDSPKTLLLAQTAALALGALPVYGLARRKTGSAPAAAGFLLRHPAAAWAALNVGPHREYLLQLLAPLLFLPLLAPEILVLTVPLLLANFLSSDPFMCGIEEHYAASITPFLFAAFVTGPGRLCRRGGPFVVAALAVSPGLWAFGGTLWGPLAREPQTIYPVLSADAVREADQTLSAIPPHASVSAQVALGPHLSHRAAIYTYPNPFSRNAWGGSRHVLEEIKSISGAVLDPSLDARIAAAPVEYVALCPQTSPFPLSSAGFSRCTTALLQSRAYGLVAVGTGTALLHRGADHAAELLLLEKRSGVRIRTDQDVGKALSKWAAL